MRVAILAETLYEDLELWYPYYRLREAGADVFVVGSGSAETYQSKHGYPVTVDAEADTVTASQFDGVIIPGGYSPDHMRRHPSMVKLVREAHEQGKVVAAICHAGWMLASANIVRGRTATSYPQHQGRHGQRRRQLGRPRGRARRHADHLAFAGRPARLHAHDHRRAEGAPRRRHAPSARSRWPVEPALLRGALLVGQSGGPTAVINASLAGVIAEARAAGLRRVCWACATACRARCSGDCVDLTRPRRRGDSSD